MSGIFGRFIPEQLNKIISPVNESGFRKIMADLTHTWQLRWWILDEGDRIEVLEPEELR